MAKQLPPPWPNCKRNWPSSASDVASHGIAQAGHGFFIFPARHSPPRTSPFTMINGHTEIIAHIGYPTHTFKSPMIYNP
jgi:hypothetical protein